jgi:hypothetical protein
MTGPKLGVKTGRNSCVTGSRNVELGREFIAVTSFLHIDCKTKGSMMMLIYQMPDKKSDQVVLTL